MTTGRARGLHKPPAAVPDVALASPAFHDLPTLQLAGGDLPDSAIFGYFAFLALLIAVPFVGGTMDTFRIATFREKRQDFIDAIEEEIEGLQGDGSPGALETSKELSLKLQDVYDEIELDVLKDEENKFLGINRYWMQMQGRTLSTDSAEERKTAKAAASAASTGGAFGRAGGDMAAGEMADAGDAKGNREGRRMAKKLKKQRPRIDNRNA